MATSPCGGHLGHYKSLLAADGTDPEEELQFKGQMQQVLEQIIQLHVSMLNFAIKNIYPPLHWQCAINWGNETRTHAHSTECSASLFVFCSGRDTVFRISRQASLAMP